MHIVVAPARGQVTARAARGLQVRAPARLQAQDLRGGTLTSAMTARWKSRLKSLRRTGTWSAAHRGVRPHARISARTGLCSGPWAPAPSSQRACCVRRAPRAPLSPWAQQAVRVPRASPTPSPVRHSGTRTQPEPRTRLSANSPPKGVARARAHGMCRVAVAGDGAASAPASPAGRVQARVAALHGAHG